MVRRWQVAVAVAAVLTAAGVGVGLAVGLRGPSSTTPTAASSSAPSMFPMAQEMRLQRGISAPTVTAQANVVALEVRTEFENRGKPLLPTGSHLEINAATFHELSPQIAAVDATVIGPAPRRWQLVLIRESGQWLLIGTRRLS